MNASWVRVQEAKGRKSREFWTTGGRQVTGWDCPDSPGYWYVPSEGSSQHHGTHLFDSEVEGLRKGREILIKTIDEAEALLRKTETRLEEIAWKEVYG